MIYTGPLGQHSSHVIKYFEVSVSHKKHLYILFTLDHILVSIFLLVWVE